MPLIARIEDASTHNGTIISVSTVHTNAEGKLVARVYDLHSCPIPGHGVTPILNGVNSVICEGEPTAVNGSTCGCGAFIIAGSMHSYALADGAFTNLGNGFLDGPAVLGDVFPGEEPFIMGA